ncbi:MAG: autotransporter-associated beta strand repeat-containing protein, partial [Alphaproteobacteria bacterium]|nr:autotransporter-associated beta strand repeat-containing protein [Alphaproteobacteria bacterium]
MLTALPAAAQDATWRTAPGSGDFDTAGNWSPTGVPTRTAFFGASSVTSLSFSADTAIGGFTFNAGASDYVFTNAQFVRFNGAGIAINGGSARIVNNGALDFNGTSTAGSAAIGNTALMAFNDSSTAGNAAITNSGLLSFNGASTAANAMIGNDAIGALSFNNASTAGSATITNRGTIAFFDTSTAGTATIVNRGGGAVGFGNNSTAGNATITNIGGGSFLLFFDTSTAGNATIVNSATVTFGNASTAGNATIVNNSGGTLNFVNRSAGGTATIVNNGTLSFFESSGGGNARIVNNAGGVFDMSGLVPTGMTAGSIEGGGNFFLGAKQLTVGSNGLSTTVSGVVSDGGLLGGAGGSLVKVGPGTLTLAGNSTYSGPTIVNGGALVVSGSLIGSSITLNGATALAVNGSVANGVTMNGAGTMAVNGNVGGAVAVNGAGALAVNGNVGGNVTMAVGSLLTGGGSIGGNLLLNGATIAPGNSIGTLSIGGNFAQNGGTYQLDANNAGQSDRINVGGAATINGGTVAVAAQPGLYLPKTTYTIVRANGGLSGAYSNVTSNFAFLVPSLSYDANDVYLTLTLSSFAAGAQTPNQYAVGAALDQSVATASGDFATVLGTLAGLSTQQGAAVLNMISGQQYAGFSNAMVQGGQLFLSSFANRAGSAAAKRVALAGACDATTPALWGAWGGAVGGTGSVGGNSNSGTFTYSTGGFVGGLDRKIAPNFLAGVTVGYQTGGQWTGGFDGRSITDTVQAGLYADFSQGPIYVDA